MTDNENALVVSPFLHHTPTLFTPTPKAAQRIVPEPSLVIFKIYKATGFLADRPSLKNFGKTCVRC